MRIGPKRADRPEACGSERDLPRLIVEVVSPSTAWLDRTRKLDDYRATASVDHIVLVVTREMRIEHWQRAETHWLVRDLGPGHTLKLDDLGIEVPLDTLYADMLLDDGEAGSET